MSSRPLRILYLAPCSPYEQSYGLQQRTLHISRALEKLGEVDVTVVGFADRFNSIGSSKDEDQRKVSFVELVEAPRRDLKSRFDLWLNPRVANPHGQVVGPAARARLLEKLGQYDLVWAHHLRTVNVFGQWRWPRTVLDIDDLPSNFQRSRFRSATGFKERIQAQMQSVAWRRRERLLGERFQVLTVCSDDDKKHLPRNILAHVIPNGFDRPKSEPLRCLSGAPRVGFIGPLGYAPNLLGIEWFARECWPQIKRRFPEARLRLVGKGSEGPAKPSGPDIDGLGWINDTAPEIATWNLMVVPLQVGGGTRLKIAEGFSRKCPIVSTALGAYGYGMSSGRELLLADNAQDFAAACMDLISVPAKGIALAEGAWRQFLAKWTWDNIEPRIIAAANDCLGTGGKRSADRAACCECGNERKVSAEKFTT